MHSKMKAAICCVFLLSTASVQALVPPDQCPEFVHYPYGTVIRTAVTPSWSRHALQFSNESLV